MPLPPAATELPPFASFQLFTAIVAPPDIFADAPLIERYYCHRLVLLLLSLPLAIAAISQYSFRHYFVIEPHYCII